MQGVDVEQELFLEAIRLRYGYDFRHYNRVSLGRRMDVVQQQFDIAERVDMIRQVLRRPEIAQEFIHQMSIVYTDLFRDPTTFRMLREEVSNDLQTYPYFKIWHAGCATGEEVYSVLITLVERGLSDRAQIYATDFNQQALEQAAHACFPRERWEGFEENYYAAGGSASLSDYFDIDAKQIRARPELSRQITFARHNLVCDGVFGEMHLIMCRNVMIYFDNQLKQRVVKLFHDSLAHRGVLCIGSGEDIDEQTDAFVEIRPGMGFYRAQHRPAALLQ